MFPAKGSCMLKVSIRLNVIKNSKLLRKINKEENKRMVQCFTFYHEWCSTKPFLPPIWTSDKPGTRHEHQLLRWYVKLGGGGWSIFCIIQDNEMKRWQQIFKGLHLTQWMKLRWRCRGMSHVIVNDTNLFFQLLRHDAYCPVLKTVLLRLESGQFIANQIWEWLMW